VTGEFHDIIGVMHNAARILTQAYASTPRAIRFSTARRVLHYVSGLSLPFEISVSGIRASRQTGPFGVLE